MHGCWSLHFVDDNGFIDEVEFLVTSSSLNFALIEMLSWTSLMMLECQLLEFVVHLGDLVLQLLDAGLLAS